jgi:predicted AAA+ superfamily ATPase
MIERTLTPKLIALAQKFQIITLTGPRQSGKTTLVKAAFPHLPYVSLENPDIRQIALTDPRGFLSNYGDGAILDEVQNAPELFFYIQSIVDNDQHTQFVLTGSFNFLLVEKINQTLAGRTAILHLLPFSFIELKNSQYPINQYETLIYKGQYPRIYDREIAPIDFYPSCIQTYVERDVRMIKNIWRHHISFIDYNLSIRISISDWLNPLNFISSIPVLPALCWEYEMRVRSTHIS